MFIVNDNKTEIINMDNVTKIFVQGKYVMAETVGGGKTILGDYKTDEQADAMFDVMVQTFSDMCSTDARVGYMRKVE